MLIIIQQKFWLLSERSASSAHVSQKGALSMVLFKVQFITNAFHDVFELVGTGEVFWEKSAELLFPTKEKIPRTPHFIHFR